MIARVRRCGADDDRGTSLVELLVGMLILGMVIAATTTLTIGFQKTNAQNITRQDQIDIARTATERVSKVVRTAVKPSQLIDCLTPACEDVTAFISASQTGMQFYANLNNAGNVRGASRVTYSVGTTGADAGVLIEKVQVPDHDAFGNPIITTNGYTYCNAEVGGASAACKANLTVRRVATGVITAGAVPLFTYFDDQGAPMPLTAGSSLTAAQIDKVLAIELTVKVQKTGASAAKLTTFIQRIQLPNAQAVLRPGDDATP